MCSSSKTFIISRSPASMALQSSVVDLHGRPLPSRNDDAVLEDQKRRPSLKRSRAGSIESFDMTNLAQATEKLQEDSGDFPSIEWPDVSSFPPIGWPADDHAVIGDDSIRSSGSCWSSSSCSNSSLTDPSSLPSKSKRRRGLVRSRQSFDLCSMEDENGSSGLFW